MPKVKKTEHAGAKNGGGHHGTRAEAKALSRTKRRREGKREVEVGEGDTPAVQREH